jgi:putative transposase
MEPRSKGSRKRKRVVAGGTGETLVDYNLLSFWNAKATELTAALAIPNAEWKTSRLPQTSWFKTTTKERSLRGVVASFDSDMLDSWLLTTEGGTSQVKNKSLLTKRQRIESTKTGLLVKTRKIRVYPANDAQRQLLSKWFGTARWTYNQCLRALQAEGSTLKPNRSGGLREAIVNDGNYTQENTWVLDTPRDIRAGAYQDLLDAYTSNFAKRKKNPGHVFDIRFRSLKSPQERIYIDRRRFRKGVIYPSKFGSVPLRSTEPLPNQLDHDAHLIRTRMGHYYLCITVDVERDDSQVPSETSRIAAIDPGVRTPHVLYDPSGKLIEFGKNDIGHLYRLCHHLDKLRSEIDLLPKRPLDPELKRHTHRKRWRMRRAWLRASQHIRNLVDDYHKKVVHFLVTHYDVVLLPAFETSRLVLRKARKLANKSARAMVTWSHFRFRQRLLWKGRTTGCKVVVCGEAYTSKTCGRCGWIHDKLDGNKTFKCAQCHLEVDRDANGARNILLKNASRFGLRVEAALGLTPAVVDNRTDAWPSRPQASETK